VHRAWLQALLSQRQHNMPRLCGAAWQGRHQTISITCYLRWLLLLIPQADSRERAAVIIGSLLGMAVTQRMAGALRWRTADAGQPQVPQSSSATRRLCGCTLCHTAAAGLALAVDERTVGHKITRSRACTLVCVQCVDPWELQALIPPTAPCCFATMLLQTMWQPPGCSSPC
jgi:hypothetical protein